MPPKHLCPARMPGPSRPGRLESLGDWAVPESSPYDCALYSANGGALITASTHPYTYTGYTAADGAERWYYSLALQIAPQT